MSVNDAYFWETPVLTYDFRLPPGPRTVEYAILAEDLGFRAVWCPEVPAFGHDIWVTLACIAEKTKRIKFGPSVLIPSYRHPMAQASAIATLERLVLELRGIPCIWLEEAPPARKSIMASRSFGQMVESRDELGEAVAAFTARRRE